MKPLNYFAVAAAGQQVALHGPNGVLKLEWELPSGAAATLYMQLHDSAVAPASGAVPVKTWKTGTSDAQYKEFKSGELMFGLGLYVVLSTTEGTLTTGAVGDTMTLLAVELIQPDDPTGTTQVGDLTTGVTGRVIWSEATGPKRLVRLEVDGTGLTAAAFIMLFAADTVAEGAKPIRQWPIADNEVLTGADALFFGKEGFDVRSNDADHTLRDGCQVIISSTTGVLTTIAAQTCAIKGEYL